MKRKEDYWFNNLNVLFQVDKLDAVYPKNDMTYYQ